jgi:N-acetyl-gamma-glutamyl-phosphate reductase
MQKYPQKAGGIASMRVPAGVAVVGATGYTGYELARLLLRHPQIENATFYLRNTAPDVRCLTQVFPQLRGWGEAPCKPLSVEAIANGGAEIVFLSTPHEASVALVPSLLESNPNLRVIDLSGAFRFREPEKFEFWYKMAPADQKYLGESVYGLPELYARQLPKARVVANPGCYATSVILGLRPLVDSGWIGMNRGIVCDCKSGASGAGKEPKRETHFVEVNENFRAYGVFTHRHTPEVADHLGLEDRDFVFTTHLLPVERGILSTLYVWLAARHAVNEIEALYREFYADKPMVRISPTGKLPELQDVAHTNFCDIGFALDASGERLVIVSCLDNLGKGAAGQAVQNMNVMWGYRETTGLM